MLWSVIIDLILWSTGVLIYIYIMSVSIVTWSWPRMHQDSQPKAGWHSTERKEEVDVNRRGRERRLLPGKPVECVLAARAQSIDLMIILRERESWSVCRGITAMTPLSDILKDNSCTIYISLKIFHHSFCVRTPSKVERRSSPQQTAQQKSSLKKFKLQTEPTHFTN